jgi:hypothetical protein
MIKKMELWLFKAETSLNTVYTAAGAATLAGSNLIEVLDGSTIDSQQAVEKIVNVAGALDQDASVAGEEPSKGTINMKMTPGLYSGTTAGVLIPQWASVLCGVSAFTVATTTSGGAASNFALTPSSTFTSAGTIHHYSGSLDANGAILSKHYNCIADWKITLAANKAPEISFTVDGAFAGHSMATQPSVTKSRVAAIAFKGAATVNVAGYAYQVISGDITGNQAPQTTQDPSQGNGCGVSKPTDRKISGTFKVYSLATGTVDPKSALRTAAEAVTEIKWGGTGTSIDIKGNYTQITKCQRADQNGIQTWDLELQWNRNDFTIAIN